MDYINIYDRFISSRRNTDKSGYTEKHHIKPRSFGGDDSKENIIILSAREHFFAHMLLAKIYGGKMWAALSYMSRSGTNSSKHYRCTSRQYALISEMDAKWKSEIYKGSKNPFYGKSHSDKALKKMRKPRVKKENMYGNLRPNNGAIISFVRRYKPRAVEVDLSLINRIDAMFEPSDSLKKLCSQYRRSESRSNAAKNTDMTGSRNPNYGNGQAISGEKNPMWGKEHSASTKSKIGEKAKRIIKCPHCGKSSNIANAHRWHLDNCKHKN